MKQPTFFKQRIGAAPRVKIADIGASSLGEDEKPPYVGLLHAGEADIVGFEPSPQWLGYLNERKGPFETYLPYAVGDGKRHTLRICQAPGMSSLLEPNPAVYNLFHGFGEWAKVLSTLDLDTVRLDDVSEVAGSDMLKLDVQGAELMVLQHACNVLKDVLVVHTEVEFLQLYVGQPLFGDIDQFLRSQGFSFHRFAPLISRTIVPIVKDGTIFKGFSQIVWADAVFVRDFSRLDLYADAQLLKAAMLVHECYASVDLANHFLMEYDRRNGTGYAGRYLGDLLEDSRAKASAA